MQVHQGLRLKKKVEISRFKVKQIVQKSGIAKSSLYDMYKKPELLRSKVEPVLNAINITADDFFASVEPASNVLNEPQEPYGQRAIIEMLKQEIEALKQAIGVCKKFYFL